MPTRRQLIAGAALLGPLALAQRGIRAAEPAGEHSKHSEKPQFLFVQNAEGAEYADGRLTRKGSIPSRYFFLTVRTDLPAI